MVFGFYIHELIKAHALAYLGRHNIYFHAHMHAEESRIAQGTQRIFSDPHEAFSARSTPPSTKIDVPPSPKA
jgi:hypothetical protein